jgi:hypothetical protein
MSGIRAISAKIETLSITEKDKAMLLALVPDFAAVAEFDQKRIARIRAVLNRFLHRLPPAKQSLVSSAICILQFVAKQPAYSQSPCSHTITDHAFCTAMRRYLGIDINGMKDEILDLANERKWPRVEDNGKIVTFYPEEAA